MDINTFAGLFGQYSELVLAIIGVCAAVAALLPAPGAEAGKWYRLVYRIINALAANVRHARNAAQEAPQAPQTAQDNK